MSYARRASRHAIKFVSYEQKMMYIPIYFCNFAARIHVKVILKGQKRRKKQC